MGQHIVVFQASIPHLPDGLGLLEHQVEETLDSKSWGAQLDVLIYNGLNGAEWDDLEVRLQLFLIPLRLWVYEVEDHRIAFSQKQLSEVGTNV